MLPSKEVKKLSNYKIPSNSQVKKIFPQTFALRYLYCLAPLPHARDCFENGSLTNLYAESSRCDSLSDSAVVCNQIRFNCRFLRRRVEGDFSNLQGVQDLCEIKLGSVTKTLEHTSRFCDPATALSRAKAKPKCESFSRIRIVLWLTSGDADTLATKDLYVSTNIWVVC